jgi:cyclophilin family peptidyl-prolyl cis-trans isomerase
MMRLLRLTIVSTAAALFLILGCSDDKFLIPDCSDGNPWGSDSSLLRKDPIVVLQTTLGDIRIELYPLDAPITVGNFLMYVHEGFYDSLTIHRVIPDFIIQGGGYDVNMVRKATREPIPCEANNGLSNLRGTIAMARVAEINSATSQFFINVEDNIALDHKGDSAGLYGYAVFGRVIAGMEVVDSISNVQTASRDGYQDVPVQPVIILGTNRIR